MMKRVHNFLHLALAATAVMALLGIVIGWAIPWEACLARVDDGQFSIAAQNGRIYFLRIGDNGDDSLTFARRNRESPPVEPHTTLGAWRDGDFMWELNCAGFTVAKTWYEWRPGLGREASDRPCHVIIMAWWWWLLVPMSYEGWRYWRSGRAPKSGLCAVCRYDLRAHQPGDKCPECGTLIPHSKTATIAGKLRSRS